MKQDQYWMKQALKEAEKGLGQTAPNPAVGAILVDQVTGRALGRGFHQGAGQPHAEVEALQNAREVAKQAKKLAFSHPATLYVTLEPCSTSGRTGACVDVIRAAYESMHIRRVVYGATDPYKGHEGRADLLLKKAGISVSKGICEHECRMMIRGFIQRQRSGRPWIIAKTALSLDGSPQRPPGEDSWLTGEAARNDVQNLRGQCDAIIIGGQTARVDNPHLTYRGRRSSKPPLWRVIVSRQESYAGLPPEAFVRGDPWADYTRFVSSVKEAIEVLGSLGVNRALLESGGGLREEFSQQGYIDEEIVYFAPLLTGKENSLDLSVHEGWEVYPLEMVGEDLKIRVLRAFL